MKMIFQCIFEYAQNLIVFHVSVSLSRLHDALAGLVDGRQIPSRLIMGNKYF